VGACLGAQFGVEGLGINAISPAPGCAMLPSTTTAHVLATQRGGIGDRGHDAALSCGVEATRTRRCLCLTVSTEC
jgi:hypothetical protein